MTRKSDQPRGLGRGLSALLGDAAPAVPASGTAAAVLPSSDARAQEGGGPVMALDIDLIAPNPAQPRRRFDEAELDELAASIREHGVLQPVIVRPDPGVAGRYQLVAGERRWRAAQRAQIHRVPAILRDLDDRAVLEIAIIENVQRADLNPIEEAQGYAQLIESFSYTQEDLSRVVGKSRSHLANLLRLLALPDDVQALLSDGRLSAGHARALITAPEPSALAAQAVAEGLSVREVERRAKQARTPAAATGRKAEKPEKDADTRMLEGDLSAAIGMSVRIAHSGEGGEVRIRYKSLEDLDRLCQHLAG
jgi:ParB family chromosome partitioning protein